jgi:chromosome segregation ATPase
MSIRKEALAALDAAHRILNKTDEFEADNKAQRGALEATRAAHEQEKARLASVKTAIAEAEADHQRWREQAARERAKANAEIDQLQAELRELTVKVKEKRAEHQNILDGISALHQRLRV